MDQASVSESFRAKGQKMVITAQVPGEFDPVKGGPVTAPEAVSWEVYGITSNYSMFDKGGNFNAPGTSILTGDKKVSMEAGVVEPIPGYSIAIMGVEWKVVTADAIAPAGEILMYSVQIRK